MENIIYYIGGIVITCLLLGWRMGLSAIFILFSAMIGIALTVVSMGWSNEEQVQFVNRAVPYFEWYLWVIWGMGFIYRLTHFKILWSSIRRFVEQRKKTYDINKIIR